MFRLRRWQDTGVFSSSSLNPSKIVISHKHDMCSMDFTKKDIYFIIYSCIYFQESETCIDFNHVLLTGWPTSTEATTSGKSAVTRAPPAYLVPPSFDDDGVKASSQSSPSDRERASSQVKPDTSYAAGAAAQSASVISIIPALTATHVELISHDGKEGFSF